MIEEPLPMDGYEDLSELTASSRVPIAGGELQAGGLPELRMMIERRCYSIFQPDAMFTGGIGQTWDVAKLCRSHGLKYSPHTWTNGIGFAVNLQLMIASGFAAEKPLEYPLSPPGWTVAARDGILEEPFAHEHGELQAPRGPGLGFDVDRKALRKCGERFFVMDRKRLVWFSLRSRGLRATLEVNRAKKSGPAVSGS